MLDFALRTVAHHLAETAQEDTVVAVGRPAADQLVLRYRESGISPHLRDALDEPDSSFPLALLLVRGALVRMGGGLGLERAHGEVRLILSFAAA